LELPEQVEVANTTTVATTANLKEETNVLALRIGNHQEAEQAEETVQVEEQSPTAVASKAKRKVKRKTRNKSNRSLWRIRSWKGNVLIPRRKKRSRILFIAFDIQSFQPIQVLCKRRLFLQVKVQRRTAPRRKAPRRKAPRRNIHLGKGRFKNGKKTIVKKK
jgi:hypothetical protein